ncbi:MAG: hypothetical protein ACRD6N_20815, partial [Pyrinomonadaceae bacterium]
MHTRPVKLFAAFFSRRLLDRSTRPSRDQYGRRVGGGITLAYTAAELPDRVRANSLSDLPMYGQGAAQHMDALLSPFMHATT